MVDYIYQVQINRNNCRAKNSIKTSNSKNCSIKEIPKSTIGGIIGPGGKIIQELQASNRKL